MKKILALMMAGVLFVISPIGALATDGAATGASTPDQNLTGSPSVEAEILRKQVEEMQKQLELQNEQIKTQNQQIKTQSAQISALISAVQATAKANSGGSAPSGRAPSGPSPADVRTQALIRNNAVSYGGNVVAQGGHVEINGGRSNVTFLVGVPDGGTMNSAASSATNLGGSLINCVAVSSQVAFRTAKVNFYITGVNVGDNVAVYQIQGGKWVQLQTAEIRKDHVVVNMSQTGVVAFIRVPVLATATH